MPVIYITSQFGEDCNMIQGYGIPRGRTWRHIYPQQWRNPTAEGLGWKKGQI